MRSGRVHRNVIRFNCTFHSLSFSTVVCTRSTNLAYNNSRQRVEYEAGSNALNFWPHHTFISIWFHSYRWLSTLDYISKADKCCVFEPRIDYSLHKPISISINFANSRTLPLSWIRLFWDISSRTTYSSCSCISGGGGIMSSEKSKRKCKKKMKEKMTSRLKNAYIVWRDWRTSAVRDELDTTLQYDNAINVSGAKVWECIRVCLCVCVWRPRWYFSLLFSLHICWLHHDYLWWNFIFATVGGVQMQCAVASQTKQIVRKLFCKSLFAFISNIFFIFPANKIQPWKQWQHLVLYCSSGSRFRAIRRNSLLFIRWEIVLYMYSGR